MTGTDSASPIGSTGPVVLPGPSGGLTFVPDSTPLVGLNYYDGRYLRADDLNLERRAQRRYAEFSNQATGGPGPVWGFELDGLGTPSLSVAAGLAVAPAGQVLHLPVGVEADVAALTSRSPGSPPPTPPASSGFTECVRDVAELAAAVVPGTGLYLVCLAAATGLCGHAEVFGRPCDDGCVTATDRPYVVDGVTLLLRPLVLDLRPFSQPGVTRPELHLRSQVASAWFAEERRAAGSGLSAAGLGSGLWRAGAGSLAGEDVVPLGVLGWDGSRITLLDVWTARRERMEPSPRSHWAGRVEQRPWPVFLAQVLQFQSQLAAAPAPAAPASVPARVLVDRGFVSAPAAFYLAIDPAGDVRGQVQDLLGPGVEQRLCAVRRDQVPHELERAQHMDRISLLRGIADPAAREQVDVLVPDGVLQSTEGPRTGIGFAVDLYLGVPGKESEPGRRAAGDPARLHLWGAGRIGFGRAIDVRSAVAAAGTRELGPLVRLLGGLLSDGTEVTTAGDRLAEMSFGISQAPNERIAETARAVLGATARSRTEGGRGPVTVSGRSGARVVALLVSLTVDDDPFSLRPLEETVCEFCLEAHLPAGNTGHLDVRLPARLRRLPSSAVATQDGEVALELSGVPFVGGDASPRSVVVRLLVRRDEQADGRQVLRVSTADRTITADVGWRGTPVEALGEATVRVGTPSAGEPAEDGEPAGTQEETRRTVATLRALEDARISSPGDPYRVVAVHALTILSGAHPDDPGYVETQARLLFPAEQGTTATTQVRAATDWVLVRRRRREDCEDTVVLPTPVSPVTAWVLRVPSEAEVPDVVVGVRTGEDPPQEGWARADLVFAQGTDDLLTPAPQWQTRYRQVNGGSRIALVGYTGAAGSEAVTTGIGRLTAVVGALTPDVELDPGEVMDFVPAPAAELVLPGTDGSVFLVTYDRDPKPDPDELAVIVVDVRSEETGLRSAVLDGRAEDVPGADPALLHEIGSVSATSLDLPDVEMETRRKLVELTVSQRSLQAVVWTHADLNGEVRDSLRALAGQVVDWLKGLPEMAGLTGPEVKPVTFDRGTDGAAARLYLLIAPPAEFG
ncbi:hypothetical protein SAMN05660464_0938 [Geodermatophilus dictyosporus]|uniref:Uncharacterized protein n=1 Tax=Geodermatophilus dictyosporus TaxID=1523247 RepID=A0A1I5JQ09_9ACTN|nr:hypothetical protein [Geodermatophilus dictyosporus]SFO74878.1 hypothetical protein SAMN05660464_0938 [Geodermatophilus dictyosporus]